MANKEKLKKHLKKVKTYYDKFFKNLELKDLEDNDKHNDKSNDTEKDD